MTKNEIAEYANKVTYSNQRTVLFFHDSDDSNGIVGYFEKNHDLEKSDNNEWNFVRTPILDNEIKSIRVNGADIKRIRIITSELSC
jgi:hypothetical protein